MDHQELLNKYAEAKFELIEEKGHYSPDAYPNLFQECAFYAEENGLKIPECLPKYFMNEETEILHLEH